jgi:phenylacetate-CoA ligase
MFSTNFNEKMLPEINDVLRFARDNKHSDFYRKKYDGLDLGEIHSYEDLSKIPFLTKDEILAAHVSARTFIAPEEVARYAFSSGTTNRQRLTIIPRSWDDFEDDPKRISFDNLYSDGVRNIMILMPPLSIAFYKFNHFKQKKIKIISGDVSNLPLMATIAKELGVQGIVSTATILDFFIAEYKSLGLDLNLIKWVYLGGEFCSAQRYEYFKKELPQAVFYFRFSSSDMGGIVGYRCEHLRSDQPPYIFHPARALIELIDESGKMVPLGEFGELVFTTLSKNKAFPLIRYKSGDVCSLSPSECPCKNNFLLHVGGKNNLDILKTHGVVINSGAVSMAVGELKDIVDPVFQVHVYEEKTPTGIKPKLELHLKLRTGHKDTPEIRAIIKEAVSANLRLSVMSTLKQLVAKNIFLPLEIKFVGSWPKDGLKHKNIISHL